VKDVTRYGALAVILAVGLALRLWHLDLKPLWLDETITLIFALGHNYDEIPQQVVLPLTELLQSLHWQPQSCAVTARVVAEQSTHPPLFFCGLHQWLGHWLKGWQGSIDALRWQARLPSVLAGVGVIAAIYGLNRVAFSHKAGLWAAALVAVSPFAVYLSQEVRHYTLPMLVITLSLISFVQIGQAGWVKKTASPYLWLAWVSLNSLGFYIHYFCFLAFVGQGLVLGGLAVHQRWWLRGLGLSVGLYGLSIMPWLSFLLQHTQRSETDWLTFNGDDGWAWLGPVLRLLAGNIIAFVMLPVETQPLVPTVLSGLTMLVIASYTFWLLYQVVSTQFLLSQSNVQSSVQSHGLKLLGCLLLVLWGEYGLLVYGFHKDLTLAFRYNFVFYPVLAALLGCAIAQLDRRRAPRHERLWPWCLLIIGLISTYCVVTDRAFLKPFAPQDIANRLLQSVSGEMVILKHYRSGQDIALGLSEALAMQQFHAKTAANLIRWGFVPSTNSSASQLALIGPPLAQPFTLWQISSLGEDKLPLSTQLQFQPAQTIPITKASCNASQPVHKAMGISYQRYHCQVP
jgi:uncharacterized membrane protein